MSEPTMVMAGTTVAWTRPGGEYPSPTWTLTYYLVSPSHNLAPVVATPGADGAHDVTVAPADSARWPPADYAWTARVTDGVDVHTVGGGRMHVAPDVATLTSFDARKYAERALEAIEALLLNKASVDQQNYSIGGRSASTYTVEELVQWRDRLRTEVTRLERAARIARGENAGGRILVRF